MTLSTSSRRLSDRRSNALDVARDAFALLVAGPEPLAVDGRDFAGLPSRTVPLDELRDQLLNGCPRRSREAIWIHLVSRARSAGPAWTIGCVGVAMPALLAIATRLGKGLADDRDDICAAALVGFLDRLSTVDLTRPGVISRLHCLGAGSVPSPPTCAGVSTLIRPPQPLSAR